MTPRRGGCGRLLATAAMAALLAAAVVAATARNDACSGCIEARYWPVSPDAWKATAEEAHVFPESEVLRKQRPVDLGVAFSGGGTRSAAAALGQLRGLARVGWLDHVRYMTAVSGGSWTAVPFTYSTHGIGKLDLLLGAPQAPGEIDAATLRDARGLMAQMIADSKLAAAGLAEVAHMRREQLLSEAVNGIFDLVRRRRTGPGMEGADKTFARLLGDVFLKPALRPGAIGRYFTWDHDTALEISARTGLGADHFERYRDKPFLIVGGTIIYGHRAFTYPALIPVEYTPLYSGVRQHFGRGIGGSYVWSWAYGADPVAAADAHHLFVKRDDAHRFTLADMIASSGAAPQLTLLLGRGAGRLREWMQRGAGLFPYFGHYTVRAGVPVPMPAPLAHGDGGFTDNLGVMPLLARGVKNILVFVNSSSDYDVNTQLQSYFQRVDARTGSGDRTRNRVFEPDRWAETMREFERREITGEAVLACGRNWNVLPNEHYNIAGYGGLNICWVYNHDADKWHDEIRRAKPAIHAQLWPERTTKVDELEGLQKEFENFPWFSTFEENKPYVIKLSAVQVNVLANLAEWTVTSGAGVMGPALGLAQRTPR